MHSCGKILFCLLCKTFLCDISSLGTTGREWQLLVFVLQFADLTSVWDLLKCPPSSVVTNTFILQVHLNCLPVFSSPTSTPPVAWALCPELGSDLCACPEVISGKVGLSYPSCPRLSLVLMHAGSAVTNPLTFIYLFCLVYLFGLPVLTYLSVRLRR